MAGGRQHRVNICLHETSTVCFLHYARIAAALFLRHCGCRHDDIVSVTGRLGGHHVATSDQSMNPQHLAAHAALCWSLRIFTFPPRSFQAASRIFTTHHLPRE